MALDKKVEENQTYTTFISPAAQAHFGWVADALPAWAGSDVLLVTKSDLMAHQTGDIFSMFGSAGSLLAHAEATGATALSSNGPYTAVNGQYVHIATSGAQFAAIMNAPGAAVSLPFTHNETGQPYNLCVMVAPDLPLTGRDLAGLLAGMPADTAGLSGTKHDWNVMIMGHEADHCARGLPDYLSREQLAQGLDTIDMSTVDTQQHTLEREIHADRFASTQFRAAAEKGLVDTPSLSQEFNHIRAIGIVMHHDTTHATVTALDGQSTTEAHSHADGYNHGADIPQHDEIAGFFDKIHDYLEFEAGLGSLSEQDRFRFLTEDPQLMYETVNLLQQRGSFADSPVQDDLARRFVTAADTQMSEAFGTRSAAPVDVLARAQSYLTEQNTYYLPPLQSLTPESAPEREQLQAPSLAPPAGP